MPAAAVVSVNNMHVDTVESGRPVGVVMYQQLDEALTTPVEWGGKVVSRDLGGLNALALLLDIRRRHRTTVSSDTNSKRDGQETDRVLVSTSCARGVC
jgi:hypothetical protein